MSAPPLSGYRYRWLTVEVTDGHGGLSQEAVAAVRHGAAVRALRVECGLGLRETAAGWGIKASTLSALERGARRFPAPADFKAALDQLWLWGVQRNPGLAR